MAELNMICAKQSDWGDWRKGLQALFPLWRSVVGSSTGQAERFLLWVDAVGGYLVCLRDEVTIGQPVPGSLPDVPILGDLSRRHAVIRREDENYSIEAVRPLSVDGHAVRHTAPLWEGSMITLAEGVRLRFRRPHPLSATARLEFVSSHRTQPSTDAVLLMAESCILGPAATSHVVTPRWGQEVMLFRDGRQLACRTAAPISVDGNAYQGRAALNTRSRVEGEEFAFSLEPLNP